MELNGTLSNPKVQLELPDLMLLKEGLDQQNPGSSWTPATPRQRAGLIKDTVIHVLELADQPMRVKDIRDACESCLGVPVNRTTVMDCLIKHSVAGKPLFDRKARELYVSRRTAHAPGESDSA